MQDYFLDDHHFTSSPDYHCTDCLNLIGQLEVSNPVVNLLLID